VQTWLMIFRGDPADGGVPIGVVNDQELCLAAVRSAWAAFRQIYSAERDDTILREGIEGMDRRLRAAAADLERRAAGTSTPTGGERFGTPCAEAFCARKECGNSLPPTTRQRGSAQKFCSAGCRVAAWRELRAESATRKARVADIPPHGAVGAS
jgi:hypothetical protein